MAEILIADDREDIHKALALLFKSRGWRATSAHRPEQVLDLLGRARFDLLLLDLNYTRDTTSGREGLDVLARVTADDPSLPVVVMTAFGSVDLAVETLRRGARDFIEKPWDNQRLVSVIENQLALRSALSGAERLADENRLLRAEEDVDMIARSPVMDRVVEMIERVGPTDANVLITGEHGAGKGLVARLLHARSKRASRPLITVNIGAIADNLFESELFGHVKGAFTDARQTRRGRFQLADGGALFLDEIGNLTLAAQAKLLRVIETGEYEPVGASRTERSDARIIAATNADLYTAAREGSFREDLLFRLNAIEIRLPPLRERGEDILLLAHRFLARWGKRHGRPDLTLTAEAERALRAHRWPGNVRELDHAVQRGVLMARDQTVTAADLGLVRGEVAGPRFEEMTLDEAEAALIRAALRRTDGNIKEAARQLGLSRGALYRRLEKHEIRHAES